MLRSAIFLMLGWLLTAATGVAQPTVLSVNNQWVAPGETIRVTVTAAPHAVFAIVASTVGTGAAFAGVALEVGEGYVVIASGVLDAAGRATISYTPPFTAAGPERIYLQAGNSWSAPSAQISLSSGVVLSNLVVRSRSVRPAAMPYVEDSSTPAQRIGIAAFNFERIWHVQIPYQGRVFGVPVNASGPITARGGMPVAYFADAACAGPAFAPFGHVWGAIGRVIGSTVYVALGDTIPSLTVHSMLEASGSCLTYPTGVTGEIDEAMPVVTFDFPGFTPPLKLIAPAP
jgi:hypothetical protein